jgi:hypothetical protein
MKKVPPITVSPGTGSLSALMTISVLQLPITIIFLSDINFKFKFSQANIYFNR